jgi:hypothetical protein
MPPRCRRRSPCRRLPRCIRLNVCAWLSLVAPPLLQTGHRLLLLLSMASGVLRFNPRLSFCVCCILFFVRAEVGPTNIQHLLSTFVSMSFFFFFYRLFFFPPARCVCQCPRLLGQPRRHLLIGACREGKTSSSFGLMSTATFILPNQQTCVRQLSPTRYDLQESRAGAKELLRVTFKRCQTPAILGGEKASFESYAQ